MFCKKFLLHKNYTMKWTILFLVSLCFVSNSIAQPQKKVLKKVMEITMPGVQGDDGSNCASVVFHPVSKKYYIPMVGNAIYPFAIFDSKGKLLSQANAGNDLRGLWYNPKTKKIEGNCYYKGGWVKYTVDAKGEIPIDFETRTFESIFLDTMIQPENQSVGVFNAKENIVYFLYQTGVVIYNMKGEQQKTIELKKSKSDTAILYDSKNTTYNISEIIYTSIPKAEIGLLNTEDKKIEFYNKATGIYTTEWILPEDAAVQKNFNFAYANGMVWLFDKENRKWVAYK